MAPASYATVLCSKPSGVVWLSFTMEILKLTPPQVYCPCDEDAGYSHVSESKLDAAAHASSAAEERRRRRASFVSAVSLASCNTTSASNSSFITAQGMCDN